MLVRFLRLNSGPQLGRVTLIALALMLLPSMAASEETDVVKALDCNSELIINLPMDAAPGATIPVTLEVVNGVSTDAADNNVEQLFKAITFWPSCTNTLPCVPDPALPISFVGPVSTDCAVDDPWTATPMAGGEMIEFTFSGGTGPDTAALTLPAAAMPMGVSTCSLVFEVKIDDAFAGTTAMQATTMGVCDPRGLMLNSSADATADLTVVPTLGEIALVVLALLLGVAAWFSLRRRGAVA